MPRRGKSSPEFLVLGGREVHEDRLGWHLNELADAAKRRAAKLTFADYESLVGNVSSGNVSSGNVSSGLATPRTGARETNEPVRLDSFDAILTRTMPAGSFEQITFRLAMLHDESYRRGLNGQESTIVNPPSALELAIDKYATLARAARMQIPTPPTHVVQSRSAAIDAFDRLGGDVVVKPIFGGEGRGVMRIQNRELAWTTFSTLTQLGAVLYVQKFIPPGGVDVRLLVIGDDMHAIRRTSELDFRTNVQAGGKSELIPIEPDWRATARSMCDSMKLRFAAVDLLETDNGHGYQLVEVNAIPGWKSAQTVLPMNVAEQIVSLLIESNGRT